MKAQLTLNNKTYEVEITDEQVIELIYEQTRKKEKRKVLDELEVFAIENSDPFINWNEPSNKYYFCFDYDRCEFNIYCSTSIKHLNENYFPSRELAERAIQLYGERLKKYVFNVEEER